jgi:hypothetical protein
LLGIRGVDDLPDRGQQSLGRLRGVDYQVLRGVVEVRIVRILFGTDIHLGLAGPLQASRADISHYADDLVIVRSKAKMASDRLFIGPVSAHE